MGLVKLMVELKIEEENGSIRQEEDTCESSSSDSTITINELELNENASKEERSKLLLEF